GPRTGPKPSRSSTITEDPNEPKAPLRKSRKSEEPMTTPKNRMRPVHPGEVLREEYLAELGMSANALASALHVPANRSGGIVAAKRAVTADTALRLAKYFGTSADFWMTLQKTYELRVAEADSSKSLRAIRPRADPPSRKTA